MWRTSSETQNVMKQGLLYPKHEYHETWNSFLSDKFFSFDIILCVWVTIAGGVRCTRVSTIEVRTTPGRYKTLCYTQRMGIKPNGRLNTLICSVINITNFQCQCDTSLKGACVSKNVEGIQLRNCTSIFSVIRHKNVHVSARK